MSKSSLFLRGHFDRLCSSTLGRNTLWALAGYGLRLVIQSCYFVVIARCLGPGQYGGFVAATALANIIAPFSGMGSGNLLIKNVAHNKNLFPEYWGNGLLVTLVSGMALVGFVVLSSVALLPRSIPVFAIFCIAVSDLVVQFVEVAAFAFQAFEMLSKNAHLNVLIIYDSTGRNRRSCTDVAAPDHRSLVSGVSCRIDSCGIGGHCLGDA